MPSTSSKEKIAKDTMTLMKSEGHTYIDLRKDGKRFVYFCILCRSRCYSRPILLQHLMGKIHVPRESCARITLVGDNPWPFNDGVWFFDERAPVYDGEGVADDEEDNQHDAETKDELVYSKDKVLISGLLIKDRRLDVQAKFIGFGRVAARLFETKGRSIWIDKIWCEWLGEEGVSDEEKAIAPEHEFAIVTFSYFDNLGRFGMLDDQSCLLTAESGKGEGSSRKRKRETLSGWLADYNDHLINQNVAKNKKERRQLKKQEQKFAEKECKLCGGKMIPGKDAATILNMKTGRLACSSRNLVGAFHVFHTSCAVHWFLFCETAILRSDMVNGKGKRRRSTKQSGMTSNELENDGSWEIYSVFCPECQGTGINIVGDMLERDTFQSSLTWKFLVKIAESGKAWVKNPEKLENCSTGFHFPQQPEDSVKGQEERVQYMKLVRFYRVD